MGLSLKLGFNSSGAGIESQTEIESQAGIESQIDCLSGIGIFPRPSCTLGDFVGMRTGKISSSNPLFNQELFLSFPDPPTRFFF